MPPRKWRTLSTSAALLLATTSCAIGPTIHDTPNQPAAATAAQGVDTSLAPGGVAESTPPSPLQTSVTDGPSAAASPVKQTQFRIGGDGTPFEFADKTKIGVKDVSVVGPSDRPGLTRLKVELVIRNDGSRPLYPYALDVRLIGCSSGSCIKRDSQEPNSVAVGGTATALRFFDTDHAQVASFAVEVVDYESVTGRFTWPGPQ